MNGPSILMSSVNEMHKILACLSAYFILENTELISTIRVLQLMLLREFNYSSYRYSMLPVLHDA
jgi:hypothetical protein